MQTETRRELHVAIIMDGNGRWARRRGLPRVAGHRAGLTTARRIVEHASDTGIRCLTLYAFSSDNWRRPAVEVERIFWLLRAFLRLETERMRRRGARLEVIGRRDRLPAAVLQAIQSSEATTAGGRGLHLRVAIDYSARDSIVRAAQACLESTAGSAFPETLAAMVTRKLAGISGEVDLLIRTGGEQRLSDFLLWESAYAELVFTPRMWPEFDEADFEAALGEFRCRERRFGAIPEPAASAQPATHETSQTWPIAARSQNEPYAANPEAGNAKPMA
ncbi:MAG TPA: di-trans,poly-cis-decaprenylcistransferase [Terracidiphilus sp.]|jgi:undecaprenyl diphosphate synthase|nr:di-trans,poly-cis-decaprenylcistransferase [Terracidiphilus sp.]